MIKCNNCQRDFSNKSGLRSHERSKKCNKIEQTIETTKTKSTSVTRPMYMVIDTETTGLPSFRTKFALKDEDYYPYTQYDKYNTSRIVQFTYQLFDTNKNNVKTVNHIVKPTNFIIPNDSVKIHKITTEIANKTGIDINIIFDEFEKDIKGIKQVIGHNILFDKYVILAELSRHKKDNIIDLLLKKEFKCTQSMSKNICKIPSKFGGSYKNPTLNEAYKLLFKKEITNAHNALYDVKHCADIYFRLGDKLNDCQITKML